MKALAPWYWRSQPLNQRSGADVFACLFRDQPIATLLESPAPQPNADRKGGNGALSQFSICAGGPRCDRGHLQQWTPPIGQIFSCLQDRLQTGSSSPEPDPDLAYLPFVGGWLGWLGYDCAWEIESLPWLRPDTLPFPSAFWYEPESFAVLDHPRQTLWLASSTPHQLQALSAQLTAQLTAQLIAAPELADCAPSLNAAAPLSIHCTQHNFEAGVAAAQRYIQAGDIFQANLSLRFSAPGTRHPWQIYRKLQSLNPSPFASYWQTPWGCIVSCSPERLVQLRDRQVQVRPIAGTRPRGQTVQADIDFAQELRQNPKERAEHTMLVDLMRNDLGRVCDWGSVKVNEFCTIEPYSHVMHLVSNVIGTLSPRYSAIDLMRAVFPGGTISGCPKVRCLEIIEALEPVRRSLFYGSCGYLDQRGHLDLNILIRTLLATTEPAMPQSWSGAVPPAHTVWGQVGAGIVADSDPTQEWLESLQKAKAQWLAMGA